jgi:hypothetical protein
MPEVVSRAGREYAQDVVGKTLFGTQGSYLNVGSKALPERGVDTGAKIESCHRVPAAGGSAGREEYIAAYALSSSDAADQKQDYWDPDSHITPPIPNVPVCVDLGPIVRLKAIRIAAF